MAPSGADGARNGSASSPAARSGRSLDPRGTTSRIRYGPSRAALRTARRSRDPRSDLDDGLRHAQSQLSRVRHPVRAGRHVHAAAPDGRHGRDRERRQALDPHAPQRPALSRRRARPGARLCRQPEALGRTRRPRQGVVRRDRRAVGLGRQDDRVPAEASVPASPDRPRQDLLDDGRHHAGAHRRRRSDQAHRGDGRERALPVRAR